MNRINPVTTRNLHMEFHKEFGVSIEMFDFSKSSLKIQSYISWLEERLLKRINEEKMMESANEEIKTVCNEENENLS